MNHLTPELDTSLLIGSIILIILGMAGAVAVAVVGYAMSWNVWGYLAGLVVNAFVWALMLVLIWFPFKYPYNHYVPVSGTVTATGSRFIGDGRGGTSQRFLVGINGQAYGCDDTRCSQLVKGMQVTLMCEKDFQFNGTSGFVCNWGKLGLN